MNLKKKDSEMITDLIASLNKDLIELKEEGEESEIEMIEKKHSKYINHTKKRSR